MTKTASIVLMLVILTLIYLNNNGKLDAVKEIIAGPNLRETGGGSGVTNPFPVGGPGTPGVIPSRPTNGGGLSGPIGRGRP